MHVGHTVDGGRHRQAGRDGRLARPPRGDRPRRDDRRARVGEAPRLRAQGRDASRSRASATSARSRAELLARQGAKIVAVTDWKGGVYNAKGLDIPKLLAHVAKHKTVAGFPGGEPLGQQDVFELDVDILFPPRSRTRSPPTTPPHQGQAGRRRRQRPDHARGAQACCTSAACSWCPTSWPTPAASRRRTSSGCRIATATSGTEKEVNDAARSEDVRGVRRGAGDRAEVQGRHAHRRLHRRDQSRRHRDEDARNVRVAAWPKRVRKHSRSR